MTTMRHFNTQHIVNYFVRMLQKLKQSDIFPFIKCGYFFVACSQFRGDLQCRITKEGRHNYNEENIFRCGIHEKPFPLIENSNEAPTNWNLYEKSWPL